MAAIVLLGDINIDLVLDIPEYPLEGGEAIATAQRHMLGGSATNTAIALSRAGHDCRLIGRVGQDALGEQALSWLEDIGVSTAWIGRDPSEPTQTNIVTVGKSGERTMFAYRGANAHLSPASIVDAPFEDAALFHLSGYALLQSPQSDAAYRAIELAQRHGIPVTLDIPAGVALSVAPHVRNLLPKLDTIMLGRADLAPLAGEGSEIPVEEAIKSLLRQGVRRIALKHDVTGSSLYQNSGAESAPWFSVATVDTTGAGDAFAAGHIIGRVSGLPGSECCRLANAFGAVAVTRQGAGLSMPTLTEVTKLISVSNGNRPGIAGSDEQLGRR
ncbi:MULTISPECIES: carbohydrate kinase family protein [unclassified Ensifer]|uniref:carbohydrate kinase family protein n=1 Tax=unclassified Ensifer TaxID=2633371 RepID=UPI00042E2C2A|nr:MULTISPECIES: carbohydrate kinase family protein [unclassified Ensifer]AHK46707.1 ribokinase [Ensifer adhaerens OV14]MDP9629469.1 ribokinase [Ensifer adhaerens]KQW50170.1 ribokinase [Ensifer sp. Root1252]KRC74394.1 ribokinase [Ensifer sp. Root231]KRD03107.1 ribokinase [Ensifer sp. Root258]